MADATWFMALSFAGFNVVLMAYWAVRQWKEMFG